MKYFYRQAKKQDLAEIMRIYESAQAFMEANGNPQWPKGFPDETDVKWGIAGGVLYAVTAENGEIAGVFSVLGYDRDYDEIDGAWFGGGKYLAVHRVATAEGYRGRGAAKFIVNVAGNEIAKARKCKSVRTDTHEKNAPMRGLLKAQGFTECGVITLMRDGTQRIAFEKILK